MMFSDTSFVVMHGSGAPVYSVRVSIKINVNLVYYYFEINRLSSYMYEVLVMCLVNIA